MKLKILVNTDLLTRNIVPEHDILSMKIFMANVKESFSL